MFALWCTGSFQQAKHIAMQLNAGVKKDCISDPDTPMQGSKRIRNRRDVLATHTQDADNSNVRTTISLLQQL